MKGQTIGIIAIALWALSAIVGGWYISRDRTTLGVDNRREVALTAAERELVLGEMRNVLASVNGVISGISTKDRKKVEESARAAGMVMAAEENAALLAKLPFEFKSMGLGLHRGFDELADATKKGESEAELLARVAELTGRCNACHDHYRVGVEKTASFPGAASEPGELASLVATVE